MWTKYGEAKCLPPGYRFVPTDDELIFYLINKMLIRYVPGEPVKDIDVEVLYSYPPNEIVKDPHGETGEWYFFIHRDGYRKKQREKENIRDGCRKKQREKENIPMDGNDNGTSLIRRKAFQEGEENVIPGKELKENQQNENFRTFTNRIGKDFEEEIKMNENRTDKEFQYEEVRIVGDGIGFWKSIGKEYPIYDTSGKLFAFKIHFRYFSGSTKRAKITHWRMEEYHLVQDLLKGEWVLGRIARGTDYS